MGGRNRRPRYSGSKVIYVHVPPELRYLVDCYRIEMRCRSVSEAVQKILETHPVLTSIAEMVYTDNDTSPQPNS